MLYTIVSFDDIFRTQSNTMCGENNCSDCFFSTNPYDYLEMITDKY